jgi:predicted PurR-regulated permease PerM
MDKKPPSPMVLLYFIALLLFATFLMGRVLWPFVSTLILSYLLASICSPVYALLNKRFSNHFSSLVTCLLIFILIFIPMLFFAGTLSSEAYALFQLTKGTNLAVKLTEFVQQNPLLLKAVSILEGYGIEIKLEEFGAEISNLGRMSARFIYELASAWAANILNFMFDFMMMILIIFFLLIDQEKLRYYLQKLSPLPDHHDRLLISKFEEISRAILIGNGICGFIQGVLGGVVFAFMGISSPVLWGAVMAILAFLPIVGIGLVLLPAAAVLLLKGKIAQGILLAIFYVFLSFSVEYIVKPQMVGERVQMHTLLVFLAILGGLNVFGFLGIIYGPLIVTGFLTLVEIYFRSYDVWVKSPGYWKGGSGQE